MSRPLVLATAVVLIGGAAVVNIAGADTTSSGDTLEVRGDIACVILNGSVLHGCEEPTTTTSEVTSSTVAPTTTESVPSTTSTSTSTTAPTTTSTSTTTPPPSTTSLPSSTAPTTTTTLPPTSTFFEDFTGNTGLERFRTGVFHRERDAFDPPQPGWVDTTPWLADHADPALGPDCGDPTLPANHHEATAADDASSFYVCNGHMMTTMGHVSGYSVVWFSPDQVFERIERVCWSVNVSTDILGHRQWWEVAIEPAGAPEASAINWLAGTANLPSYGEVGAVVLGFGPDNPPYPKISVGDTVVGSGGVPDQYRGDLRTRVHQCFADLGNGTLRYTSYWPDGVEYGHWDAPGAFPVGPLQVVFKDHNYTPNKDCEFFEDGLMGPGTCRSYSWHWDNIEVS